jgi:hypothetical protein
VLDGGVGCRLVGRRLDLGEAHLARRILGGRQVRGLERRVVAPGICGRRGWRRRESREARPGGARRVEVDALAVERLQALEA